MEQPKKNHGRPKKAQNKYKEKPYTEEDLQNAIKILDSSANTKSCREVAKEFKIPEATLRTRRSTKSPTSEIFSGPPRGSRGRGCPEGKPSRSR